MASVRHVLIVGAGIAGLATAVRLRRSGWRVTLVERAPALRGGGYMIGFSGIGYEAARRWGLLPALSALQPAPVELQYVDESGRQRGLLPVQAQQAMVGEEMLALLRGDLESVLYQTLDDDVDVRFGVTITGVAQDQDRVTVTLSDGSRETVDLLVGADGLHSAVREEVFGPEERFRVDFGCAVATFLLDHRPAAVSMDRTVSMSLVGRGVGLYSTGPRRAAGFCAFASDDLDADLAAGAVATLRRVYGDLGWVVPELLDQAAVADSVYFDRISQITMSRWSKGRVVLVGDAAWCVSLFAGYGSSLAVGGADVLGNLLDEHTDLTSALDAWEEQLRPTVLKKQRQGRRAKSLFVAPSKTFLRLQVAMYQLAGSRLVQAALRSFLGLEAARKVARS